VDKKYLGKSVNLPVDTYALLLEIQQHLTARLGFTPSLSECIQYLITFHQKESGK
jgi:hypothetical protein